MSLSRTMVLAFALAAGLTMVAVDAADAARVGSGRSFGSRGSRTDTAPPATNTAPKAAPIEKSMTQKTAQPGTSAAAQPSRFGGLRGLLMGGLIGAALASIFGFGALASVLGFLLQFAIIGGLIYLAVLFFRSRQQPAQQAARQASMARSAEPEYGGAPARDVLRRNGSTYAAASAPTSAALTIGQEDLDTFERLLGDIQTAYGREDTRKLGAMTTPEMLSYFSQDLADNAKQGLRNEISGVKLLQGDISEAWREEGTDYATVAMRYSLIDATIDEATGRVVDGDRSRPTEATEFWTFRRDDRARADGWQLSAIQQTA